MIIRALSLARNTAAAAISSGSANRPVGICAFSASPAGLSQNSRPRGVSTTVGLIVLAVTPRPAHSRASTFVNPTRPGLGDAVRDMSRQCHGRRLRSQADNRAAALRQHDAAYVLTHGEGTSQIHREGGVPLIAGEILSRTQNGQTSAVDQDVDAPEASHDFLDGADYPTFVGDVAGNRSGYAARFSQPLHRINGAVEHNDGRPLARVRLDDGLTNPRGAAGHHGDLVHEREAEVHGRFGHTQDASGCDYGTEVSCQALLGHQVDRHELHGLDGRSGCFEDQIGQRVMWNVAW